jgi:hypothetical protein
MKLISATNAILDLAVDDYTGLWEVVAAMREIYPNHNDLDLKDTAVNAIKQLLKDDYIHIYQGDNFSGEETKLKPAKACAALSDEKYWAWEAAELREHIRLAATGKGEKAYYHRQR